MPKGFPRAVKDLNRLAYFRQTGEDGYYLNVDLNPWILDPDETKLWLRGKVRRKQ